MMGGSIDDNQQWVLGYAIAEACMTKAQFCRTAGIEKVEDLEQSRYANALAWLEKKITQKLDSRKANTVE